MKDKLTFLFLFLCLIGQNFIMALEIDEKLTLRILSLSSTKKTILVNRGLEDGLVVGDHAKLFVTTGVIARAVIIKASPTRSVWSISRTINKKLVEVGRVMNLKIATPVRITEDESKSIAYQQQRIHVDDNNIPLETKVVYTAENDSSASREMDRRDLNAMEGSSDSSRSGSSMTVHRDRKGFFWDRSLELWTGLNFQSLSGNFETTSNSVITASAPIELSTLDISAGFEKYFANINSWIQRFSFGGIFRYTLTGSPSGTTTTTDDWMEFGLMGSWHFGNSPFAYGRLIGFVTGAVGIGGVSTGTSSSSTSAGTTNFYSAGFGAKYYIPSGFGMRALVNYYARTEVFAFDDGSENIRSFSGPKFEVAFSFRW